MRPELSALLASLILAISGTSYAAGDAGEPDHHSHGGDERQQLEFNAGKKWATDAPLRQAMTDINQAMAVALPLIHMHRFGEGQYHALATTVRQAVAYAVEQCKLAPKADAMLHLVIADLLAGAESMDGKSADLRHGGAVKVVQALQAYGKYFQHPGWKAAAI